MIMNKDERPSFLRGKGAAVGIVICFVAVIAMVGAYTFNNYQDRMDEQVAKAEEKLTEDNSEETTANDIVLPEADSSTEDTSETEDESEVQAEETPAETEGSTDDTEAAGTASEAEVWFSEDSTLAWPASGAVLIGYSMDHTVFFSTLEQYKYNPALIIGGEVGETIAASAAGIVTNIEDTAQTGTTVTLDMGNGYSAVYGQLTDVPVAIGDYIASGETIGTLNEPTKYYSVEGPNLYFEILKDGEPVDPMNFME